MNNVLVIFRAIAVMLIFGAETLMGQVSLQFAGINEYAFNTRQAVNLIAVNSNTKAFTVLINGKIRDGQGMPVADFKTAEVVLAPGANVLTPLSAPLAEINYHNQDIAEIERAAGVYPSGNYTICLWTTCVQTDCNGAGSDAANMEPVCNSIHVENPTPLLLASPENGAEIETTRPLYTWIPPSPIAASAGLNYTMILVEIIDGQSQADALTQNRPIIEMDGIANPMLMHPSDIPELEKGKWYAWQVQASVGKTPFAKSEQWKFKVKKDTLDLKKIPREQSYIEIKGQSGASMFYAVGVLKLRHIVRLENGSINMEIKDINGKVIKLDSPLFKILPGDNRLDLDLSSNIYIKHGQQYSLFGYLLNGEPFTILFTYINPQYLKNN